MVESIQEAGKTTNNTEKVYTLQHRAWLRKESGIWAIEQNGWMMINE